MNFNEILNGVAIELICLLIVAIINGIYKVFKRKFKENTRLFMIKLKFYLCLIFIIIDTYILRCSSFPYFFFNLIPLLIIVICCIIAFHEALKYNNDNSK